MPEITVVRRVAPASTIRDSALTGSYATPRIRIRTVRLPRVAHSAAFFDLDKTVIAKSSALAFGRPFYRDGLINRRDVLKGVYSKLLLRMGGSDEQGMARTRDYLAELCQGWQVEQVQQIVRETLDE